MAGATAGAAPRTRRHKGTVLGEVIEALRSMAQAQGRDDLAARLDLATWRLSRPETLVCVVGEFKKGKSALVNALLGQEVCPSDDDLATSTVTLVRHAGRPEATVRRRAGGAIVIEDIDASDIARWTLEQEGATDRGDVVLVEAGLPKPLLERGIALVDTPGVGGLDAAHAVATLAFLPSADALVFVTDASAELTGSEMEFLSKAAQAGPPILLAVAKTDMYPEWRRIVSLDADHLRAAGMALEPVGVSSVLCLAARDGDASLADESGVPDLVEAILSAAGDGAHDRAVTAALAVVEPLIAELRAPHLTEQAALEHPEEARAMADGLEAARERLELLTAAGARWAERLDTEFEALRSRLHFDVEAALRQRLRSAHDELERVDPALAWPELSRRFQEQVAGVVRSVFSQATQGATRIQGSISAMLADEEEDLRASGAAGSGTPLEVADLWQGGPAFAARSKTAAVGTVGLLAGAGVFGAHIGSAGLEMLGLLGTLFGAAIVGPAMVGATLVIGGKRISDERRRLLVDRRQEARTFLARFVDDVRFEIDGRLDALVGDMQREMRAHYADRIRQLQRANTERARALERGLEQDAAERKVRLEDLGARVTALDELGTRLMSIGQSGRRGRAPGDSHKA